MTHVCTELFHHNELPLAPLSKAQAVMLLYPKMNIDMEHFIGISTTYLLGGCNFIFH